MSRLSEVGFSICALAVAVTLMLNGWLVIDTAIKARDEVRKCEASLPRNEHCVITAIPRKEVRNDTTR